VSVSLVLKYIELILLGTIGHLFKRVLFKPTAALVCDALIMALWRYHMPKGVIVHSDREVANIVLLPIKSFLCNIN
jgi:hypothetical protein